jgi:hypothetical protein
MEIGSFLELDLRDTGEYYSGSDVVRLNAARAGIYHACKLYGVNKIYVPYYQCPTVSEFLTRHGMEVVKYTIDENFEPKADGNTADSAFLIVNYFGILSSSYLSTITQRYKNVIVDNCPAFYSSPMEKAYAIYSPRKFFGVPDGCYLVGPDIGDKHLKYPQDVSSNTAGFLLKRIEQGCNAVYSERMKNEERIDQSGILQMSELTRSLLSTVDYEIVANKRRRNFNFANELFQSINLINPLKFFDVGCVPMVYPLVIQHREMVKLLAERQIYTGRWWNYVLLDVPDNSFESFLSTYMIPIPIDQRYGKPEIAYVANIIFELLNQQL